MSAEGSVTNWLAQLQAGDREATQELWQRYYHRLVGLARDKLRGITGLGADEEDVALSALESFFRRAEEGRFPDLRDRDNLWRLLFVITERKAFKLLRDEGPALPDGKQVLSESGLLQQVASREPTGDEAAQVTEELRRLLHKLDDPELCLIAVLKMEGFTNEEIARSLDCAPRTVERKVKRIRDLWERELSE